MARREGGLDSSVLGLIALIRNFVRLVLAFLAKISFQQVMIILAYHSVAPNGDFYSVNPYMFRRQMDYLRKNYSVLPLAELSDFVKTNRKMPKKVVSITFDDGYHDFYINAYPCLKKYKLPATVFVATEYVGKTWPFSKDHAVMLSWEEISEISRNNIEIGAHTVTHPNLQQEDLEGTKYELIESKKELEKHLKREVEFLSYPFGRHSQQTIVTAKAYGFKCAVGGRGSVQKDSCLFALNRVQIDSSISFLQFVGSLTKAVDWLGKVENILKSISRKDSGNERVHS